MRIKDVLEQKLLSPNLCAAMTKLGLVDTEELPSADLNGTSIASCGPLTAALLQMLQIFMRDKKTACTKDYLREFALDLEVMRDTQEEIFRLQGIPDDLDGQTFLDVGCWEGWACVEAKERGAIEVVGIDLITTPQVLANSDAHGFQFFPCDATSEKFLALPSFDIVSCAGLFFHVESPVILLRHLRKVTRGSLFLDTICLKDDCSSNFLFYCGGTTDEHGISMWFVPTKSCVEDMLKACGFECRGTALIDVNEQYNRVCFFSIPKAESFMKALPRKCRVMRQALRHNCRN